VGGITKDFAILLINGARVATMQRKSTRGSFTLIRKRDLVGAISDRKTLMKRC